MVSFRFTPKNNDNPLINICNLYAKLKKQLTKRLTWFFFNKAFIKKYYTLIIRFKK